MKPLRSVDNDEKKLKENFFQNRPFKTEFGYLGNDDSFMGPISQV
jgi:hypothetical protein